MNILPHKKTWLQILFWCSFWALVPLLLSGGLNNPDMYIKRTLVVMVAIGMVVWVNMEVLLPKLYFGRYHPMVYVVAGLALVTLITLVLDWDGAPWDDFFHRNMEQQGPQRPGNTVSGGRRGMRYLGIGMPIFTSFIGSALFEIAAFASRKEREIGRAHV